MSEYLQPHGPWPTRLLCPWNSPGQITGVGSCSLLKGIFPTQGSNLGLLHCRRILYCLNHQGNPGKDTEYGIGILLSDLGMCICGRRHPWGRTDYSGVMLGYHLSSCIASSSGSHCTSSTYISLTHMLDYVEREGEGEGSASFPTSILCLHRKLQKAFLYSGLPVIKASLEAQAVEALPAVQTWIQFLDSTGKTSWRRGWPLSPVFLPEELHGQRSLAGYSPWGRKESDMT